MGVDVLQALREFVIESIHKTDNAAAYPHDIVGLGFRGSLGKLIVVRHDFLYGIMVICGHDVNQLIDLFLGGNPKVDGHVRRHGGVVIESSRYECQENPNLLILCHSNLEQLFEDADLLGPVGVLGSDVNNGENRP
jgi:hypothetical protein